MTDHTAENDRGFDALVAYERAKLDKSEAFWSQECGHRTSRVVCQVERWDHGNVGHDFVERVIPPAECPHCGTRFPQGKPCPVCRVLPPDEPTVCIAHGRFIPCRKDGEHRYTSNPYWVKSVRDYQGSTDEALTWEPAWERVNPPAKTNRGQS